MRLQVFLSHSGVASRRRALELVLSGRVTVNQKKITEPSYDVRPSGDEVRLDGRSVALSTHAYILLNKPKGVTSTVKDPHAIKTVLDLIPPHLRAGLYPVGRLDKDTTGLLFLTNDGATAHKMSHPSFETEKTYRVVLDREPADADMRQIRCGVELEGKRTYPCQIKKISAATLEIVLHEGRKRQIRKVFALFSYRVRELQRIKQGGLALGSLKEGAWRLLTPAEVKALCHKTRLR